MKILEKQIAEDIKTCLET